MCGLALFEAELTGPHFGGSAMTNRAAVTAVYRVSAGGTIVLVVISALHFFFAGGRELPLEAILVVPLLIAVILTYTTLHPKAAAAQGDILPEVNPATGLPMRGSMDVAGNPYGSDLHRH